jgi:hypothetical protein
LLDGIQNLHLTPREFQLAQAKLKQSIILDHAPIGCSYNEVLAELLGCFRLGVVLDKQTSWSRTSWLAGQIDDALLLVVVDATAIKDIDRVSIDIWSNLDDISDEILKSVQDTSMGAVPEIFASIGISWKIDYFTFDFPCLVLSLTASRSDASKIVKEMFFAVDYQGILSETFKTVFPTQQEQISLSMELGTVKSTWLGNLEDPYLLFYFSDAEWKSENHFHKITITWKEALVDQIEALLATGSRMTKISELSAALNLKDDETMRMAKNLFFEFCLDSVVEGCQSQRVSDYCKRCVVLSGLMICFNPERGLSGYLELVFGSGSPNKLHEFGTERTWRDHLSNIVSSAQDFQPIQVELVGKRKLRGPGRPPTQLMPMIPLTQLFRDFVESPERIVCRYCRFSNEK